MGILGTVMFARPAPSRPRPWRQGQGQNTTNKAYNADITLISVQLFTFVKWLLPVLRLTILSDNDRKFVAFGRKNTGISQTNGLDDLCEGWPYKAKDLKSQGQGLTLGTVDLGGAMHSTEFPSSFEIVNYRET